jgi:hypothetical protein
MRSKFTRPCLHPADRCNMPVFDDDEGPCCDRIAAELFASALTCRESGPCDSQAGGAAQHVSLWIIREDLIERGILAEPCPENDFEETPTNMVCHHVLVMN